VKWGEPLFVILRREPKDLLTAEHDHAWRSCACGLRMTKDATVIGISDRPRRSFIFLVRQDNLHNVV
jgi:hypothetical protein